MILIYFTEKSKQNQDQFPEEALVSLAGPPPLPAASLAADAASRTLILIRCGHLAIRNDALFFS